MDVSPDRIMCCYMHAPPQGPAGCDDDRCMWQLGHFFWYLQDITPFPCSLWPHVRAPFELNDHGAGQSSSAGGQDNAHAPATGQPEEEQERPAKRRKGRKGAKTGGANPLDASKNARASFSAASTACKLHNNHCITVSAPEAAVLHIVAHMQMFPVQGVKVKLPPGVLGKGLPSGQGDSDSHTSVILQLCASSSWQAHVVDAMGLMASWT